MSEQPAITTSKPRRAIQVSLERVRDTRYGSMFGVTEIFALGGAILVLLIVVISYLYFLVPARSNLETAKQDRTRLQTVLSSSKEVVQKGQTTEAAVTNIVQSLNEFESGRLFGGTQGRMDLYEEVNSLINKNALRNTSGPVYVTLEPTTKKQSTANGKSAGAKWQSVYPGIAISVTVEGQYANLRRFVRDIEASKLFLIINAVELERASDTDSPSSGEGGSARASLVSLRLEMATYFQRGTETTTESLPQ
ncbi:MAG TPA: GspMb/PilO family protein [Pyrinomonadaceae bacterium]